MSEINAPLSVSHLLHLFRSHLEFFVRAGVNAPATLAWYLAMLRPLAPLGELPAAALRPAHLAAIPLTNGFIRALKRLYRWAMAEELVPRDPFAKLRTPRCGRRERILTRAELVRLYRASSPAFRRLLFVLFHTLARPGEIRQLTWGQIDWPRRLIILVKFKGQKQRADQLAARAIPLPLYVGRFLANLQRKSRDPSPTARVFYSTREAKPWTANAVRCAMRRARAAAGLDDQGGERVVPYTLRHTGATNAIRLNANVKKLAALMGHARTATTERYIHLDSADLVATIDSLTANRPRARERRG